MARKERYYPAAPPSEAQRGMTEFRFDYRPSDQPPCECPCLCTMPPVGGCPPGTRNRAKVLANGTAPLTMHLAEAGRSFRLCMGCYRLGLEHLIGSWRSRKE